MASQPVARKTEILRQLTDYISEHGFKESSLRPLAAAVGTNARMLIYHFKSRDSLLGEVAEELRLRHHELFRRWLEEQRETATEDLLTYLWNWSSSRRVENIHRVLFESVMSTGSAQRPLASTKRFALDWIGLFETALGAREVSAPEARTAATWAIASVRGLMFDLFSTGDRTRVNAAAQAIATAWKLRFRAKSR